MIIKFLSYSSGESGYYQASCDEVIFVDHARCDQQVKDWLEHNWVVLVGKTQ